jgi:CRISPR-associated protein Csx17
MNTDTRSLSVIRLAGLHLDTLGHYFAALGLLRIAARKWSTVKCCWHEGVFCLAGGPDNLAELETFLFEIGASGLWTPYSINRPMNEATDSQEKKGNDVSLWLAQTSESDSVLGMSHVIGGDRRNFNPTFGTGGNAGKRNFQNGWEKAFNALSSKSAFSKLLQNKINAVQKKADDELRSIKKVGTKKHEKALKTQEYANQIKLLLSAPNDHLKAFIKGANCSLNPSVSLPKKGGGKETVNFLTDYGAACWFSEANKVYNFSPDKPYREGQLSPWAMLLACEAFPLLVGTTSRQIGSRRQGTGAFPFVTQGAAPKNEKEAGTVEGEFWAPVWGKPLSLAEVTEMFKRGRAEVDGRGAITSAAFAAAIIQKGTDAGLLEFRRFSLLHTTSAQTFESRLASIHPIANDTDTAQADAVSKIISFRDSLPNDKEKASWRYRGLQGPIDHALIYLAEMASQGEGRIDASWHLLDIVFSSLANTAKNKEYRKQEPVLTFLPVSWAISLLKSTYEISLEAKIAIALATLRPETFPKKLITEEDDNHTAPLIAYRVGVVPYFKNKWSRVKISKNTPLRVVWSHKSLVDNICAVIHRRVMIESDAGAEPPFNTQFSLSFDAVSAFLNNELDDALVDRWLTRFMLFDWSSISPTERGVLREIVRKNGESGPLLPEDFLYILFRPLFHFGTFAELAQNDGPDSVPKTTVNALRQLVALLERGDCAAAHSVAVNRYKALLQQTADFGENIFDVTDSRRLLAALLLPTRPKSIVQAFVRWVTPTKDKR